MLLLCLSVCGRDNSRTPGRIIIKFGIHSLWAPSQAKFEDGSCRSHGHGDTHKVTRSTWEFWLVLGCVEKLPPWPLTFILVAILYDASVTLKHGPNAQNSTCEFVVELGCVRKLRPWLLKFAMVAMLYNAFVTLKHGQLNGQLRSYVNLKTYGISK